MTPAQLVALGRPCFSPDDWTGGWYRRCFVAIPHARTAVHAGDLICSRIVTLDVVSDSPEFLPPALNRELAAWHVSLGFMRGPLERARAFASQPITPGFWGPELHRMAKLNCLEALAGVGQGDRDHYWVSHVSAHLWRPPAGHELDGVADAAAERIGRVFDRSAGNDRTERLS